MLCHPIGGGKGGVLSDKLFSEGHLMGELAFPLSLDNRENERKVHMGKSIWSTIKTGSFAELMFIARSFPYVQDRYNFKLFERQRKMYNEGSFVSRRSENNPPREHPDGSSGGGDKIVGVNDVKLTRQKWLTAVEKLNES
jgi:hypothetical protein